MVSSDGGVGAVCDGVVDTCTANLLCVMLECRTTCRADSECAADERCLLVTVSSPAPSGRDAGSAKGVCVTNASVECSTSATFCPDGTSCMSDAHCRDTTTCSEGETKVSIDSPDCSGSGCGQMEACFGSSPHDTRPGADAGPHRDGSLDAEAGPWSDGSPADDASDDSSPLDDASDDSSPPDDASDDASPPDDASDDGGDAGDDTCPNGACCEYLSGQGCCEGISAACDGDVGSGDNSACDYVLGELSAAGVSCPAFSGGCAALNHCCGPWAGACTGDVSDGVESACDGMYGLLVDEGVCQ
jgi:hypothetical protein